MDCKSAYSERKKMRVCACMCACACEGRCILVSVGVTWKLGLQVKCGVASVDEVWGSHSSSASLRRGGYG